MDMIEIYNNYSSLGISSRPITQGKEFDMVKDFIEYKKEHFRSTPTHQMAIFIETKINNSYPDIIFTEYNPVTYLNWNINRQNLNTIDLKVLHYIFSKKETTSAQIINTLSIQYKPLLHSLERLMDASLITRKDNQWIIVDRNSIFGVKRIEAVEAKIGKWEEVMQQAIINKNFASESFVLTKLKRKPETNFVEKINTFGIGIYLYDDTSFSCYARARRNRFPSNYNSIYLNECIGRILNT